MDKAEQKAFFDCLDARERARTRGNVREYVNQQVILDEFLKLLQKQQDLPLGADRGKAPA